MRKHLLRCVLCFALTSGLVACFGSDRAPAVDSYTKPADGFGIYEGCHAADQACVNHLKVFADGGFKLVLNYNALTASTADQVTAYADAAQKAGLKIIWAVNDPQWYDGTNLLTTSNYVYGLAPDCGCTDNTGFITYLVNLVKDHPATWGYYIMDEGTASPEWIAFSELIHQLDPNHPRLVVLGTHVPPGLNEDLRSFAPYAEVLSQDYYPVGYAAASTIRETINVAAAVQSLNNEVGKDTGMVLQAFSWTQYYPPARCTPYPACAAFPTRNQMTEILNYTLEHSNPRLVLWYHYPDILKSDRPNQHWADLVAVVKAHTPSNPPALHNP